MQTADAIHGAAPAYCQIRHIERLRVIGRILAAHGPQSFHADAQLRGKHIEVPSGQIRRKTVETCRYGSVSGEKIPGARGRQRHFERRAIVGHVAARPLQYGESGVSFI
jgi:hypothetical protein